MSRPTLRPALWALAPILALGAARGLSAQSASCTVVSPALHASAAVTWAAPLDRRISLRAQDITLQQALDRVARMGDIRLSYSSELLPRDRRVCVKLETAPIGDILTALLAGTDLDPLAIGGDQ